MPSVGEKWFKKEMIVKIPKEKKHHHHHHHGHHHAASEGHQSWAMPVFFSTPSTMHEIMDAWSTTDQTGGYAKASQADQTPQSTNLIEQAKLFAAGAADPRWLVQQAVPANGTA